MAGVHLLDRLVPLLTPVTWTIGTSGLDGTAVSQVQTLAMFAKESVQSFWKAATWSKPLFMLSFSGGFL